MVKCGGSRGVELHSLRSPYLLSSSITLSSIVIRLFTRFIIAVMITNFVVVLSFLRFFFFLLLICFFPFLILAWAFQLPCCNYIIYPTVVNCNTFFAFFYSFFIFYTLYKSHIVICLFWIKYIIGHKK